MKCDLPTDALLITYREAGAYTDCFVAEVAGSVSQADYVAAFYSTKVFKLERLVLAWFVSRPSTDAQANALARGNLNEFAAWDVEGRTANQLLMRDLNGRTRSWLMSVPIVHGRAEATRLYFGSAVVPTVDSSSGRKQMGLIFRTLLGFHKLYSRVLLRAAVAKLRSKR